MLHRPRGPFSCVACRAPPEFRLPLHEFIEQVAEVMPTAARVDIEMLDAI